ncbi:YcgL domain-containing protein [Aeromonas caviae]|uniref:YcgL domain-containing protein n=1 Tax=Aeromonas caviae TaxID=648 RepID=UPI00244416BB|nr:YcgL domain-containing protein [Aeromonas caviae]
MRSQTKPFFYLFQLVVAKDPVHEVLMSTFGRPELVLMTKLDPAKPLGLASTERVMSALKSQGFYLQVPPPPENLLEQHKAQLKGAR